MLLFMLAMPAWSSEQQILRHIEALSRDYYYIDINDPNIPFQTQDIVGGEHETVYHILGFSNETFIIVMQSIEGSVNYALRGDGFDIKRRPDGDIVMVEEQHTWISIQVSAHPYAEYKLTVKKYE